MEKILSYFFPEWKYFKISIPIYIILFILYLEVSPRLGNVWLRYDHRGKLRIHIGSLLQFIYQPFTNSFFWKPEFWDLNIYVGIYIFTIIIKIITILL